MFTKTTSIALATVAASVITSGAQASPRDPDLITVRVSVADLNLASKPGASVALQRIRRAATSICGDEPRVNDLSRMALYDACLRSTVGRAVASLDNPLVTALYGGRAMRSSGIASR